MNRFADTGNFIGCVRAWNGGTNGLADRRSRMAGNEAIINRLKGSPPSSTPSKDAFEAATEKERKARSAGGAGVAVGTGGEASKHVGIFTPDALPALATGIAIGVGLSLFVAATIMIVRKRRLVTENWY